MAVYENPRLRGRGSDKGVISRGRGLTVVVEALGLKKKDEKGKNRWPERIRHNSGTGEGNNIGERERERERSCERPTVVAWAKETTDSVNVNLLLFPPARACRLYAAESVVRST